MTDSLTKAFVRDPGLAPTSWKDRVAEHELGLRASWEAEGSPLGFEAWRDEHLAKERAAEEERIQASALEEHRERNTRNLVQQIPPRYFNAQADNPQVLVWAVEVAESTECNHLGNMSGPSLLIVGPTGVGKTHQAFGALRHVVNLGGGRVIRVTTAADLYAGLRPRSGLETEEAYGRFANAALLFIDDIGAAKSSEWVEEINYRLINHRYNNRLATLITSNVPPRELANTLGNRVASRLTEMCTTVALKGDDRRRSA